MTTWFIGPQQQIQRESHEQQTVFIYSALSSPIRCSVVFTTTNSVQGTGAPCFRSTTHKLHISAGFPNCTLQGALRAPQEKRCPHSLSFTLNSTPTDTSSPQPGSAFGMGLGDPSQRKNGVGCGGRERGAYWTPTHGRECRSNSLLCEGSRVGVGVSLPTNLQHSHRNLQV